MRKNILLTAVAALVLTVVGVASAQQHYAELTMVNHTDFLIRFTVDDQQVCPSDTRPGFDCDHELSVGDNHTMRAIRVSTGEVVKEASGVPNGDPIVWTVCYLDQHAGSCGN